MQSTIVHWDAGRVCKSKFTKGLACCGRNLVFVRNLWGFTTPISLLPPPRPQVENSLVAGNTPEAQDKIKLHGAANFG
jgi:hypothetical protein